MPVFAYDGKMKKSLKIDDFFCIWVLKNGGVYDIICKKYAAIPVGVCACEGSLEKGG